MLSLMLWMLVAFLIAGLVFWVIGLLPLPPLWSNAAKAVVALIFLIWILQMILPMAHSGRLH